ncbi:putative mitochondrial Atp synthase, epsilon chain [Leptomonas pyrrhocoris]|uniref:Putative mitochondrial Atp synthase, epsilon chain n=1 Tax=Leptomonas pyrrhocoris TaxID=157538 RepID=A0A0M9G6V2_LEPPY|nr:putative mitochondrial Atp synthase, epsilon chain [Leptomonas pyrrhocoris]XP_015661955.1 putative mitochondrial Atp synthase, epsilon chain [Leptomonas pyrrhocoris]XP_015661956.1 putative mitochondrial Atp synthase, epsilon chain [Leptomonas pyrrhocoris]KPA83515.1 putative mitochondrial Atp synthase, epsilon chain [Leptomonas pyrrhocoris]KPA83516.1 putative mitochondrial Atp synthase, epsilon chain [Leptomonas pyrrhocoris]KPA83517.1 putative mitochondrial Atp synthase, epsilon chain [Lepto|eukprot:XP_015661954.1 putative mitochondrial Atp synthase, epsilon chain [Leptomonas pyrrhocoris]
MFRFCSRRLVARTLPLLAFQHDLPEAFEFIENKVVDKDIHAPYENMETLRLTVTRQDEFIFRETPVKCVTITGVNGENGVYPGHAYEIMQLAPAPLAIEMPDGTVKKYFTSGGFAHINNEGSCDINCVECIPFADLDVEAAEKALAQQNAALSSAKDDKAKALVEVRIGVLEAVIRALKHM